MVKLLLTPLGVSLQEMVSQRMADSAKKSEGLFLLEDGTNSGQQVKNTCLNSIQYLIM